MVKFTSFAFYLRKKKLKSVSVYAITIFHTTAENLFECKAVIFKKMFPLNLFYSNKHNKSLSFIEDVR